MRAWALNVLCCARVAALGRGRVFYYWTSRARARSGVYLVQLCAQELVREEDLGPAGQRAGLHLVVHGLVLPILGVLYSSASRCNGHNVVEEER